MKNTLEFKVPFSNTFNIDFIHSFTAAYMHIENINSGTYNICNKWNDGTYCDYCRNCINKDGGYEYNAMFETMCGRNAIRIRYDGELSEAQKLIEGTNDRSCGTDFTVDFLFGFVGYDYRKCTDVSTFKDDVISSVDIDKPVIAEFNSGRKRFRVIIGYDGDTVITGNTHTENKTGDDFTYDELKALYIFGDKTAPRYMVSDGIKNIRNVMESNVKEGIWNDYIKIICGGSYELGLYSGLKYADDNTGWDWVDCVEEDERKRRMNRLSEAATFAFNSCFAMPGINMAKSFCEEADIAALNELTGQADIPFCCVMDFCHNINNLNSKLELWNGGLWDSGVQGYGVMVAMAIECNKQIENRILDIIKQTFNAMGQR
jgi:hypothetical protein